MLQGFLLVILVLVCIALGTVILLQRSEGGAFGMGGGPSGLMTARGAGDLLTRITSILAAIFFILCLTLTILSGRNHGESVVDRLKVDALNPDALNRSMRPTTAPATTAPVTSAPATSAPANPAPGANVPLPLAAGAPAISPSLQPAPAAKPTFEAPRPQVHTSAASALATPPAVTTDSGARSRVTNLLGVQTAPQAQPTLAPRASRPSAPSAVEPSSPPATAPTPARPAAPPASSEQPSTPATSGNTTQ